MQVIKLPSWLIKHVDRIRRNFLWKGHGKCLGGHCLINWKKCCLPKANGGLGIKDLQTQNDALLFKWIWNFRSQPNSVWASTLSTLYGTTNLSTLSDSPAVSHGLRDILRLDHLANASIDPGQTGEGPRWRWSPGGNFTTRALYAILQDPGQKWALAKKLWRIRAPPRVKIFAWILLEDKLLTQDNLIKRGSPTIQSCTLCQQGVIETASHLFLQCHLAASLWAELGRILNLTFHTDGSSIARFWTSNRTNVTRGRCAWDTVFLATVWEIWKIRNKKIFQNEGTTRFEAITKIREASRRWSQDA